MSGEITREAWLAEFERVLRGQPKGDPGLTTWELIDALGAGEAQVNHCLRAFHRAGTLLVGQRPACRRDGRRCLVPCYRLEVGATKPNPAARKPARKPAQKSAQKPLVRAARRAMRPTRGRRDGQ